MDDKAIEIINGLSKEDMYSIIFDYGYNRPFGHPMLFGHSAVEFASAYPDDAARVSMTVKDLPKTVETIDVDKLASIILAEKVTEHAISSGLIKNPFASYIMPGWLTVSDEVQDFVNVVQTSIKNGLPVDDGYRRIEEYVSDSRISKFGLSDTESREKIYSILSESYEDEMGIS